VTWEDQQNINTFNRLNNRLHELEDEVKARKVGILCLACYCEEALYIWLSLRRAMLDHDQVDDIHT
jgi:hypothetical protein